MSEKKPREFWVDPEAGRCAPTFDKLVSGFEGTSLASVVWGRCFVAREVLPEAEPEFLRAKTEEELKRALTKLSQIEDVLLERLHDVCEAQRGKLGK